MMLFAEELRAIVAGDRTGAGALEVVWVREMTERDLSKNSTTDWHDRQRELSVNRVKDMANR